MRTIVELPPDLIDGLAAIAQKEKKSRAALIREAIRAYLAQRKSAEMSDAFGLWADRKIDGLAYEQTLRDEWGDR